MQKSQLFRREADKLVEPRLLEARLKLLVHGFLGAWDSSREGTTKNQDSGAMEAFRGR